MPATQTLKHNSITDFSPGIADNPGFQYPPGQAQRDLTYRCIANRDGALTPLPLRSTPFPAPTDSGGEPTGGYSLNGIYASPIPLLPSGGGTINPDYSPEHQLFIGNEWYDGVNRNHRVRRYRLFESPGTVADTIISSSFADTQLNPIQPVGMQFGTTRINRTTPLDPGVPVVIILSPYGAINSRLDQFPDDTATTSATPYTISTAFMLGICCHQGRVIIERATAYNQGPNATTFMGENLAWTKVNDSTTASISTPDFVAVAENPSGFAFMASMSANELFAVKAQGGLYCSGDIEAPTIVNIPMIVGSDVSQTPAVSPIGVVYGSQDSGIWTWHHGDTTDLLSPKMDPNFWTLPDTVGGVKYQFAVNDDWILAPNNWLFDTNLKSWWRLEDEDVVQFRYLTSFSRYIYASQTFYTNAAPNAIHKWVRGVPTTSFSWNSQPLFHTLDTTITMRSIAIRAAGTGTVKVTITDEDGHTDSATFYFDSDLPHVRHDNVSLTGTSVSCRVESSGPNEAPTIYELDYGYYESTGTPVGIS